jgi:hypothetical protein
MTSQALSPRNFNPLVFIYRSERILGGAQKCAAHSLHRLTHERPACERPTRGRRSVGVATAARYRANVAGNSARTDGLYPSLALGLHCTEEACSRSGRPQGHPAVAMEGREA